MNLVHESIAVIQIFYLLLIAAVFELTSDEGVIDIIEGMVYLNVLRFSGFTYDTVPIRVYSLSYSEYEARGFSLADDFDLDDIPMTSANGLLVLDLTTVYCMYTK